jgi:hypothetical protein
MGIQKQIETRLLAYNAEVSKCKMCSVGAFAAAAKDREVKTSTSPALDGGLPPAGAPKTKKNFGNFYRILAKFLIRSPPN